MILPDMSIYKLVKQEVDAPDYRGKYCGKSQLKKKTVDQGQKQQ